MRTVYYNGNQYYVTSSRTIIQWHGTRSAKCYGESYLSAYRIGR